MKRFDLMFTILMLRGSYLCSKTCLPFLKKSKNPHILKFKSSNKSKSLSGLKILLLTQLSKYAMSMNVIGNVERIQKIQYCC